jgi:predicted DNA-binding protein
MLHEAMTKQANPPEPGQMVTLSVRVTRETADALKVVADREYRPVAAEIRRLIETRIAEPFQAAA